MTPEAQTIAWGIATIAPLSLNFAMKRGPDTIGISAMIVLIWTLGRIFWALWSPPESMALYPLIDATAGMTVFTAWLSRRAMWKAILTALFVVQVALHTSFWAAHAAWPEGDSLTRYIWANNLCYALQLIVVASPGGFSVSRLFLRSLPRGLGPFRHARLGPWR